MLTILYPKPMFVRTSFVARMRKYVTHKKPDLSDREN